MKDYKSRSDSLSKKEQDTMKDMKIVQEMYARGFEFEPIDIFRAHSRNFQIFDGKIMPSLSSIDGLGEKAADAIVEAAKDGPSVCLILHYNFSLTFFMRENIMIYVLNCGICFCREAICISNDISNKKEWDWL